MEDEFEYKEMYVDEMKQVKKSWQAFLKMAKNNLNHVLSIEETKENRWELKSLEESYKLFIHGIKRIIKKYSELIDLGEMSELEEDYFLQVMEEIKIINNDLTKESESKNFRILNKKHIESLRKVDTIAF